MIYTLTLNPAVDYYISFDKFNEGELNIPLQTYKLAGGKGINVSKILKNYGKNSICLGFLGGFTGDFIKNELKKDDIKYHFIDVLQDTRINIKMNNNGLESEIAGISPDINDKNLSRLFEYLKENLKKDDIFVLSGSVPSSLTSDIYSKIIKILPKETKIILDTRGQALKNSLSNEIFLIKPNKDEINEFFNSKFENDEELIEAGKKLQRLGAKNVLISLGKNGSILITENDEIYKAKALKGELISSNGAGDSMMGGFVYGLSFGMDLLECYKYAVASGSGTAFSKGLVTFEKMNSLLNRVVIEKI